MSYELLIFKAVVVSRTTINVGVEIESDNEFERKVIVEFCESNKIPEIVVDSIFWDDSLANDNIDDTDWTLSVVEVENLSVFVLLFKFEIIFVDSKLDIFTDSVKWVFFKVRVVLNEYSLEKLEVSNSIMIFELEYDSDNEFEWAVSVEVWVCDILPESVVDSIFWDKTPSSGLIVDSDWSFFVVDVEIWFLFIFVSFNNTTIFCTQVEFVWEFIFIGHFGII